MPFLSLPEYLERGLGRQLLALKPLSSYLDRVGQKNASDLELWLSEPLLVD
jgi:hypothetical protein